MTATKGADVAPKQQTPRQQALEAALQEKQRLESERAALVRKRDALSGQIAVLQATHTQLVEQAAEAGDRPKDLAPIREQLAGVDAEIAQLSEILSVADRRIQGVSEELGPVSLAYGRRVVDLQREPCEQALQALNHLLRQVEQAWALAGHEALRLEREHNEDAWGRNQLARLRNALTSQNIGSDGPLVVRLPSTPDEV